MTAQPPPFYRDSHLSKGCDFIVARPAAAAFLTEI
jgi:hypothetical protein